MEGVNWLSIVISSLIPMIVGFIYYHKSLFGNAWMKSIGMTEEKARQGNMAVIFGVSLVLSVMLSFFLLGFNNSPGQEGEFDTFKHGAFHGVIVSLFVAVPVLVTSGLFEQRSRNNLLINVGYWVITLALMGGVVDAMNHMPNEMVG